MKFQCNILNMRNVIYKIHIAYFWVYNLDFTTISAKINEMLWSLFYDIPPTSQWFIKLMHTYAFCIWRNQWICDSQSYNSIFLAVIICPPYISYGRKFWSILFKAFGFHKVCNLIFKFIFWWNNLYSQSYSQLRFRSGIDLVYFILEMLEFMF